MSSLNLSPDGRTIVGIADASLREDGRGGKSKLFIWDAECLLRKGEDCQNQQHLPWLRSRFLYWRAGANQFVVDSLTLQQVDAVAPYALHDLKSFAIARWPTVMWRDAPDPAPSSEKDILEGAVRYLSSDGRVALRLVDRDEELHIVAPEREIIIPRHLYDLRTLMPNRYEIIVQGDGAGFYFWSGSMGVRGQLERYAGRQRRRISLPADLKGRLEIVFPPSARMAVAAFTPDGIRSVEHRGPLVSLVDDHVQAVRRARPDLELKAVRVSEDCETWALLFASIGGIQEIHVFKPKTGKLGTMQLSDTAPDHAISLDTLSSHYVSIPGRQGALPARHYARLKSAEPRKLIIRFHGGPPVNAANDISGWVRRLSVQGFDVLDVDYRGSPGYGAKHFLGLKRPAAKIMKQDLRAAVSWARHQGYAQVGFLGTSAGGLAGAAAMEAPGLKLDFMVLESPLIDQPKGFQDIPCSRIRGQTADRVFGLRQLPDGQCDPYPTGLLDTKRFTNTPVFLVAGERDLRTPFETVEAWVIKARASGASCIDFVTSKQGGHTLYDWPKSEERRTLLALESWLSRVGSSGACPPHAWQGGLSRSPGKPTSLR